MWILLLVFLFSHASAKKTPIHIQINYLLACISTNMSFASYVSRWCMFLQKHLLTFKSVENLLQTTLSTNANSTLSISLVSWSWKHSYNIKNENQLITYFRHAQAPMWVLLEAVCPSSVPPKPPENAHRGPAFRVSRLRAIVCCQVQSAKTFSLSFVDGYTKFFSYKQLILSVCYVLLICLCWSEWVFCPFSGPYLHCVQHFFCEHLLNWY